MTPSYAIKRGARYRYYVSSALVQGNKSEAGSVVRVAAQDMEDLVVTALRNAGILNEDGPIHETLHAVVDKVAVGATAITVTFCAEIDNGKSHEPIRISWTPPKHRRSRSFSEPGDNCERRVPPSRTLIRAEARARLLIAIATARSWLDELVRGDVRDLEEIAQREGRSERSVRMILSLTFLAPDVVTAAIAGTLPRGLGLSDMTDLPMDWSEQRCRLGLARLKCQVGATLR